MVTACPPIEFVKFLKKCEPHRSHRKPEMTNNASIAKANAAFRSGDYETAEKIYKTLLSRGGVVEKIAKSNLRLISAKTGKLIQPSLKEVNHKNIKPLVESLKSSDGNLIITYPIIPWAFRIQRPQHLVARLSKQGFTSLYIANVAPPTLPSTDDEILDCLGTRELAAGVHEIWLQTEQGFNMYKTEICGRNLAEMTLQLQTVCRYLNPKRLIHLVQFPGWTPLAERVKQVCGGSIVYDCMDHHAGFTNNTGEALSQEERLIRNADLVLASSLLLERELKPRAREVLLIKNATEYEHFRNPKPNGKLDHLKDRPIIGYYGAIADWFDIDLVTECAKSRPDWNFVLIGSTDLCDTSRAEQISNIHFFGEIPYKDLPGYFSYFDVCTIPFKIIPLTEATNPVKFYEYMSAGKPVVSTELPELRPYSDYVYFASEPSKFVKQIEKALETREMLDIISARQNLAANNDWNARAEILLNHKTFARNQSSYRFSIILVAYNELESTTKPCIESILKNTPSGEYELIVVDNLSTKDETREYLTQLAINHRHIKIQLNDENKGFSGGNNDGLKLSTGEFVVLLNNDTLVTQGWLDKLIKPFYTDPKIGLLGPITNSAGGTQKIEIGSSSVDKIIEKLSEYSESNRQVIFEVNKLGFFCVAFRSRLINEIGLLDESFGIGMFEDDEFSHRAKAAGYKCVINEGCYVYHKGSASFSKMKTKNYQDLFNKNRGIFREKAGYEWTFSGILQEYIDYIKFSVDEARNNPDRALNYVENIHLRMPSIEWLSSHINNLEANFVTSNTVASSNTNTRPRSLSSEEVLNAFGQVRNSYINGKRVIIFPPTVDWNYMTQRPQQLAKAFAAKGFAVLYATFCAQEDYVDFYDITPDGVMLINQAFLVYLNHLITPSETIYFCVWPTNLHYAEVIPHYAMVYDIIDDISLLQGNQDDLKTRHLEAMTRATCITVSARLLAEKVPQEYQSKTILVQNAVADEFIAKANRLIEEKQDASKQELMRSNPNQIVVGYVGAIAEWMDFGLIEELLNSFPDVMFVFIGPIFPGGHYMKNLESDYTNITLIPEKKHEELPFFIRQFDVCIIPFLLNKITHAVSPVKLFEYAAFGKPIITTAMRECESYECIKTAGSHSGFLNTLRDILSQEKSASSDNIRNLAFQNTWSKRVDVVLENIASRSCV